MESGLIGIRPKVSYPDLLLLADATISVQSQLQPESPICAS